MRNQAELDTAGGGICYSREIDRALVLTGVAVVIV